jgi:hypothetical protein
MKNMKKQRGQSLIETVLVMPLLLWLLLTAVNFAYMLLMAINAAASPRNGIEYSIMGNATPAAIALPPALNQSNSTSVAYVSQSDMLVTYNPSTNVGGQVCSPSIGPYTSQGTSNEAVRCSSWNTTYTFPSMKNECNSGVPNCEANSSGAPLFTMNKVDVVYRYTPLIPSTILNAFLYAVPSCSSSGATFTCSFHRYVVMRAMI